MGINNLTYKAIETIQETLLEQTNGNLGSFSVSANDGNGNDIAKSSAIQYHEIDIDDSKAFHKKFVLDRKRIAKSKFAKKSIEDLDDEEDPDIDEPTGEGSAYNDTKYQRLIKSHLVKLAQNNALKAEILKLFGN
ncbi:MAG: hypothetical protein C5B43_03935 [Verrucomicrobia bacterium]|nr:MAG: hypothetical protein C5B43_03935 [Verrucomicrobiota bacterium]